MEDNYIGKRIDGRYDIISLIGVGGMSNVYKAVDNKTGNTVAIKFLKHEFFENEELVRRFKNESKAISLLDNPNIIKVYDVKIAENEKYIVVEYIDGITLKDYMDNRKVLTWQETVRFTGTILAAIGHAHKNGIVHRDLKPQNVMLLRDGTLKIMDFGIARLAASSQRTMTDKAIGSVHYISPEQVKGKGSDARSDIYSIGIMMYEMLTGTLPFVSDTAVSVAMKQVSETPRRPSEIVESVPRGLEQIVMKAIEKDPRDRYQSADEMLADLSRFKANPAIIFDYGSGEKTQVVAEEMPKKSSKSKVKPKKKAKITLPMMAGIAAGFAVTAAIAIFFIFKLSGNPLLTKSRDVELPNFTGMTEEEVNNAGYKFRFDIEYVYSGEYPAGTVFSQTPKPPKNIKENGNIRLKVSRGPQSTEMPQLQNYNRSDAEQMLADMEVNVSIVTVRDANVRLGYVIKTDPEAGTTISTGDTVTLYISSGNGNEGKNMKTVPSVLGVASLEEASRILALNDLAVGTYTYREDATAAGTVVEQSPRVGEKVPAGSRVNLVLSSGPPTPPPPPPPPESSPEPSASPSTDPGSSSEPTTEPAPTETPPSGGGDSGGGGEGGGDSAAAAQLPVMLGGIYLGLKERKGKNK